MKNKILLGVTGGIAIYKVCDLVSRLRKRGYELKIIMTESATKLVSPLVFETMGSTKVYSEMFHEGFHDCVEHIALASWADLFLIAPASANTMAKINYGIADNLLTATALAYDKPITFCVAMNTNMLNNPATQENLSSLTAKGHDILSTDVGMLACNTFGSGRMKEPEEIAEHIDSYFTTKDLSGKKILVTAGSTIERIDPVRYITNDSSGKMGIAIAKRACYRGAEVTLIVGKHTIPIDFDVKTIMVQTTEEMKDQVMNQLPMHDSLIMAAAPCDFKPMQTQTKKIKKTKDSLQIEFIKNPDILKSIQKVKTDQKIIGFAAETDHVIENAQKKLKEKALDYIVVNDVTKKGAGFHVDTNIASILTEDAKIDYDMMPKIKLADKILDCLKG